MRPPLDLMILRRPDLDAVVTLPAVTDHLKTSSPLGGSYGAVRSGGHKWHNGWDLYAAVGTSCFSVTPGEIVSTTPVSGYGRSLVLKLSGPQADAAAARHGVTSIYALYGHLSAILLKNACVAECARLALSGADGNAAHLPPHLHIEIRTTPTPKKEMHDSIDPAEILGYQYYASRADDLARVKAIFATK